MKSGYRAGVYKQKLPKSAKAVGANVKGSRLNKEAKMPKKK